MIILCEECRLEILVKELKEVICSWAFVATKFDEIFSGYQLC